jgi:hypothetical protein
MSRAFVREDGGEEHRAFALPHPDDPEYDAAAAFALLEAARDGQVHLAEQATGYRWGETILRKYVRRMLDDELARPTDQQDARFVQMARRFLKEISG